MPGFNFLSEASLLFKIKAMECKLKRSSANAPKYVCLFTLQPNGTGSVATLIMPTNFTTKIPQNFRDPSICI